MAAETGEQTARGNPVPQYMLCFIVNIISFSYGMTVGWLSPMQPLLQANYTNTNDSSPLGVEAEPLSYEEVSWISGSFCIGGILATPLYGYFANAFGRKMTAILSAVPFFLAFGLKLVANSPLIIFAARFIAGLGGGGVCLIVPMYIGETSEDHIRGVLGSYFNLFLCFGILFSFIIGSYTGYFILGIVGVSFPILFMVFCMWLPETPVYSLTKNRTDAAMNALKKLRGNHKGLIEAELEKLAASVRENAQNKGMSMKDMINDKATLKGLIIGGVCMTVQQCSGVSPILNYTVAIFDASGSKLSPNLAAIIVGALQLVGALVATIFMDRLGRKFLLLVSSVGMSFSLIPIAVFFKLKFSGFDPEVLATFGWVPVTSLAIYIIVYAVGFGPVPWVLCSELFKTEAKSPATSFCVFLVWAEAFILLKFFSKLSDLVGIDMCFGLFALCCALGAAFTCFYIPETKGKSLEHILWQLGDRKTPSNLGNIPIPMVNFGGSKADLNKAELQSENKTDERLQ
ncbi:UNVERIFIED_CONTAM: hypothetical protein PYX00_009837 [Menopon gallinae]|uniref:Major facilitator superfamily (MFS) profile domain-containing protein n=1 Tax=Menopon gallinae TaxID=328185 RepID=A0AAW2HD62_9NEOP